jgi:predicted RNA-binding protein YlxR (DUF448 family)
MKTKITSSDRMKRVPVRTCVACRQTRAKRELVRLVLLPGVGVEVDLRGKKPGRGAYLCPTQECWTQGLKSGRLEHSLGTTLSQDNRERLVRFGNDFFKELVSG